MPVSPERENEAIAVPLAVAAEEGAIGLRADLVWAATVLLCTAGAFLLLEGLRGVAVPVLIALGLAWALDPLIDRFEARGWSRTTAIVLLGAASVAVVGAVVAFLVPTIVAEAQAFPAWLQATTTRLLPLAERLLDRPLPASLHELSAELSAHAAAWTGRAGPLLLKAVGGTASAASAIFGLALIPVLLFYFLRDFDRLKGRLALLFPPRYRAHVAGRFHEIDGVLAAFVRGQATVAAILGCIYAAGLTASGVKMGLVIGGVAGLFSLVPFAGVASGLVLSAVAILADLHDGSLWTAAGAGATFAVGQILEGYVITPRIVGEKVGLSAAAVILAVLVFGELFGFTGLLLAVPLAAVLQVVARVLLTRYLASGWYRKNGPSTGA